MRVGEGGFERGEGGEALASASDSEAAGAPLATAVGAAAPSHDGSLSSDASQAALAAASFMTSGRSKRAAAPGARTVALQPSGEKESANIRVSGQPDLSKLEDNQR